MAVKHGTRYRYSKGCRCDACAEAERIYQRDYRLRGGGLQVGHNDPPDWQETPGPVESGVQAELEGLADIRPGLAQAALAFARILDNPKAISIQPASAKVLARLLDELRSASAPRRRGHLTAVRTMSKKGGA